MGNYMDFLDTLEGNGRVVSLFEPFVPRGIAMKLIWRSGEQLWDTTEHRVMTLCDLYAYLRADTVTYDLRGGGTAELERLCEYAGYLPDGMKFVIISDDEETLEKAAERGQICAAASFTAKTDKLPLIRLSRDGGVDSVAKAAHDGCKGIYLPEVTDDILTEANKHHISLLGGTGTALLNTDRPTDIHERIAELINSGVLLTGSGGFGDEISYLGYISMLGAYNRVR